MESTQLEELTKAVETLTDDVGKITKAILGDSNNDVGSDPGFKRRLDTLENRMERVEDFITKWKWIVVGAIAFAGYGGLTFTQSIIELINHTKK